MKHLPKIVKMVSFLLILIGIFLFVIAQAATNSGISQGIGLIGWAMSSFFIGLTAFIGARFFE
jgi:hypothetical protein